MVRGCGVLWLSMAMMAGCFSAAPVGDATAIACNGDVDCPAESSCLAGLCRLPSFVLPTAADLVITVVEDQPVDFELPDGSVSLLQLPAAGVLELEPRVGTFRPPADFVGTLTATYTVTRDGITSGVGTLTFVVQGENDVPQLLGVELTIDEDTADTVLSPFTDPDFGDTFSVVVLDDAPVGGHLGSLVPRAGFPGLFTFRPDDDRHGVDRFLVELTDAAGAVASASINITILPIADASELLQPVIVVEEDGVKTLPFDELFADADGPVSSVIVVDDSSDDLTVTVDDIARTITFTPDLDAFGDFRMEAMVEGDTPLILRVNVANASDLYAPVPFEGTIDEDALDVVVGRLQVSGAVAASLEFSLISGPVDWPTDAVQVSQTGVVTATPPANLVGAASFRWQAIADGDVDNGVVQGDGLISVTAKPDAVVLSGPTEAVGDEDQEVTIPFDVIDVDDPLGEHELTATASMGTVRVEGREVALLPLQNYSGPINLQVFATSVDGRASDPQTVVVTIRPVVDPPQFFDFSIMVDEDSSVRSELVVLADGGDVDFFAIGQGASGTVDIVGGVLFYQPAPDFVGSEQWFITAVSEGGNTTVVMNVNVLPVNDAPQIAAAQVFTCTEDRLCELPVVVTDPDSPASALRLTSTDTRMSQLEDGRVQFALDRNFNGSLIVPITGSDDLVVGQPTFIVIQVVAVADPLVVNVRAPAFAEDTVGLVAINVEDVDNIGFRLEASGFVGGTLNSDLIDVGVVLVQPSPNVNGTFSVTVRAIPSTGAAVSLQQAITIAPVNDPPTLQFVDPTFLGGIDGESAIELIATDVDGDVLSVDASADFEGRVQSPSDIASGGLEVIISPTGRPERGQSYFEMRVIISDQQGESAIASRSFGQVLAADCSLLATTNGSNPPSAPAEDELDSGARGCKTVASMPYTPALGWGDEPGFSNRLWNGDGDKWNPNTQTGVGPGFLALSSQWRWVRTDQMNAETNLLFPRRREMPRHFDTRLERADFEWEDINIDCGDEANIVPGSSKLACRDNPEIGFGLSVGNASEPMAIYVMASDFRRLGTATCDDHEARGAFISGLYLDGRGAEIECVF